MHERVIDYSCQTHFSSRWAKTPKGCSYLVFSVFAFFGGLITLLFQLQDLHLSFHPGSGDLQIDMRGRSYTLLEWIQQVLITDWGNLLTFFAVVGLLLMAFALVAVGMRRLLHYRVLKKRQSIHPTEPWHWEFYGQEQQLTAHAPTPSLVRLLLLLLLGAFVASGVLVQLNDPNESMIVVGLFLLLWLFWAYRHFGGWYNALLRGKSRLVCNKFPVALGTQLNLNYQPRKPLPPGMQLVAELCFIKSGQGNNRMVGWTQRYSQKVTLPKITASSKDQGQSFNLPVPSKQELLENVEPDESQAMSRVLAEADKQGREELRRQLEEEGIPEEGMGRQLLELAKRFNLQLTPTDYTTRLFENPRQYWELTLTSASPELKLKDHFLIPIYEK